MCPLTRAPFSFWISFTSGQLFILPWSTSNEMDAKECIKLGYCSTTSAHSFWFVIFSAMVFLSFFLCLLIFSKTFFSHSRLVFASLASVLSLQHQSSPFLLLFQQRLCSWAWRRTSRSAFPLWPWVSVLSLPVLSRGHCARRSSGRETASY